MNTDLETEMPELPKRPKHVFMGSGLAGMRPRAGMTHLLYIASPLRIA
jgi:hypothetical protein